MSQDIPFDRSCDAAVGDLWHLWTVGRADGVPFRRVRHRIDAGEPGR